MSEPAEYVTEIDPAVLRTAGNHAAADAMDEHGFYTVVRDYSYTFKTSGPTPAAALAPEVRHLVGLPSSSAVAASQLPAFRVAAREKYGRVKMVVLSPFLAVLLRMAVEFFAGWLVAWLKSREEPVPPSLAAMARGFDRDMMPEVRVGLARAAKGDTGE